MEQLLSKNDFTARNVEAFLSHLKETDRPLWGIMTPQHAVEHLTVSLKASVGKTKPLILVNQATAEKNKNALIADDRLWPQGLKNALLPSGRLFDLKYTTFGEAREKLIYAVYEFETYYSRNPNASHSNPFLGYLSYEEWKQFHFKHFRHHFIQFGLLENIYDNRSR